MRSCTPSPDVWLTAESDESPLDIERAEKVQTFEHVGANPVLIEAFLAAASGRGRYRLTKNGGLCRRSDADGTWRADARWGADSFVRRGAEGTSIDAWTHIGAQWHWFVADSETERERWMTAFEAGRWIVGAAPSGAEKVVAPSSSVSVTAAASPPKLRARRKVSFAAEEKAETATRSSPVGEHHNYVSAAVLAAAAATTPSATTPSATDQAAPPRARDATLSLDSITSFPHDLASSEDDARSTRRRRRRHKGGVGQGGSGGGRCCGGCRNDGVEDVADAVCTVS